MYEHKREYHVKNRTGKAVNVNRLMNENFYYYAVVVALLKDSLGSKDHIVSFSEGWLFDSNLTYALPLTINNLNWCCGNHINGATFEGFHESFVIKEKLGRK